MRRLPVFPLILQEFPVRDSLCYREDTMCRFALIKNM